jgi:hypothetical protein
MNELGPYFGIRGGHIFGPFFLFSTASDQVMTFTHEDTLHMSEEVLRTSHDTVIKARKAAREMAIRTGDTLMLINMSLALIEESDRAIALYGTLASPPPAVGFRPR